MRGLERLLLQTLTDQEFLNKFKQRDFDPSTEFSLTDQEKEILKNLRSLYNGEGINAFVNASSAALQQVLPEIKSSGVSSRVAPKLERVQPKLQRVAPKLDRVAPKLERVSPKLERVEPKLQRVAPKLERVEPKLQRVAPKLERVEPKLERIEGKLARIEGKLSR